MNRAVLAAGQVAFPIRSEPMFDLLLPMTAIFCACSAVVWSLALLDMLK
jgi:hypothetical protein